MPAGFVDMKNRKPWLDTQSRQSAMPYLQSSELGLPQPLTRRRVCPPRFGSWGEAHSLARKGVGDSQFRRGDIHCTVHCGTLYYKYFLAL